MAQSFSCPSITRIKAFEWMRQAGAHAPGLPDYTLANAVERHRSMPDIFEMPGTTELNLIEPGVRLKVCAGFRGHGCELVSVSDAIAVFESQFILDIRDDREAIGKRHDRVVRALGGVRVRYCRQTQASYAGRRDRRAWRDCVVFRDARVGLHVETFLVPRVRNKRAKQAVEQQADGEPEVIQETWSAVLEKPTKANVNNLIVLLSLTRQIAYRSCPRRP